MSVNVKQSYDEIANMNMNGITLSTGKELTPNELMELRWISRLNSAIETYDFVSTEFDDGDEYEEIKDLEFYDRLDDELCEIITGEDEYNAVQEVLENYKGRA